MLLLLLSQAARDTSGIIMQSEKRISPDYEVKGHDLGVGMNLENCQLTIKNNFVYLK